MKTIDKFRKEGNEYMEKRLGVKHGTTIEKQVAFNNYILEKLAELWDMMEEINEY